MTWVKLDDRFFDNPKIAVLSGQAKLAYLEGLTYCAREMTDGFLPELKARGYAGKPKVLKELTPGLWVPARDGYRVHDYLQYQPTRAETLKKKQEIRQIRSQAGSKGAEKRWQKDGNPDDPVTPIPEGDLDQSPSYPENPEPLPRSLPRREVVLGFEQCFARLLSPTELELVKALEEEHPLERIEYALRESAALNKRNIRYIQRTCERVANDGDGNGTDRSFQAKGSNSGSVAPGLSDVERRRAAVAERGRESGF